MNTKSAKNKLVNVGPGLFDFLRANYYGDICCVIKTHRVDFQS